MSRRRIQIQLRDTRSSDLDLLYEQQTDKEAYNMAAFTLEDPTNKAAYMKHMNKNMEDDKVTLKTILSNNQIVGNISLFERLTMPEVSYWIGKEFWGRGIATLALTDFLNQILIRPLFARVAKDNIASIRVLEKCGFRMIGEDKAFANARSKEVEEYIMKLDF